jgi:serine/threonine protein kinase
MQTLGRYEIRSELGRGGMGVVLLAYDPTLDREVAIKSVRLDGVDEAARASLEERLSREARAAAKLQHPNIVAVYDFFRLEDRAYIVMEYVRGSMLDAMILAGNRQNTQGILKVLGQVASALDCAHAQGIVHRDIKPGNILIDESGRIKITDFGIARITSAGATETMSQGLGSTVGTLGYMAPEQIRGEAVDGRADQFSLGIVAYQLFTGEMPFQADSWIALSYKIIHDAPPVIASEKSAITVGMQSAMEKAIAKLPGERFANCTQFVDALSGAVLVRGPVTGRVSEPIAQQAPKSRLWVGAALLVVLLAGLSWLVLRPKAEAPVASVPAVAAPVAPKGGLDYTPAPAPATPAAPKSEVKAEAQPPLIEFVPIPAGQFYMGSDTDEDQMRPRHLVRLTQAFEMAVTETTEKQWNAVMTGKPTGGELPKSEVSWNDAQAFIAKLNAKNDGYHYRLPTEAEWEYAALGKSSKDRPKEPADVAWFRDNSDNQKHEVRTLMPNGFGLYDMLGNVSEWTADWFEKDYYQVSPALNPKGAKSGEIKISRGGAYDSYGMNIATSWRFGDKPDFKAPILGFRVVRVKR